VDVAPGAVVAGQHARPHDHVVAAAGRPAVDARQLIHARIEHPPAAAVGLREPRLHRGRDLDVDLLAAPAARTDRRTRVDHEAAPMAKIRHIALSTQDPDATAKFYVDVFGLKQVGRIDNPNTSGYYLTDGEINLAILKFKNDKVAGVERGKDWSGIHHFGFQVDDLDDTSERLAAANAPRRDDINEALGVGGHAESGAK